MADASVATPRLDGVRDELESAIAEIAQLKRAPHECEYPEATPFGAFVRSEGRNTDARYSLGLARGDFPQSGCTNATTPIPASGGAGIETLRALPRAHVAPNERHTNALRNASRVIGVTVKHGRAWWGLWFTHAGTFSLGVPARVSSPPSFCTSTKARAGRSSNNRPIHLSMPRCRRRERCHRVPKPHCDPRAEFRAQIHRGTNEVVCLHCGSTFMPASFDQHRWPCYYYDLLVPDSSAPTGLTLGRRVRMDVPWTCAMGLR